VEAEEVVAEVVRAAILFYRGQHCAGPFLLWCTHRRIREREAEEMADIIILIIFVPLMAFIGLGALGTTVMIIYRDVLRFDNKVSDWFEREFGTGHTEVARFV
jgi:hypothetical protein